MNWFSNRNSRYFAGSLLTLALLCHSASAADMEDHQPVPLSPRLWLQSFSRWSDTTKTAALNSLVHVLHQSANGQRHMQMLAASMRPLLQRDFVASLPEEIATTILGFLDPRTLCACAQVSRAWRYIANQDALWRPLVAVEAPNFVTLLLRKSPHRVAAPKEVARVGGCHIRALMVWVQVYMAKVRVDRAWRSDPLPAPMELEAHHGFVVTCLARSPEGLLVSGSDDATLRVWDTQNLAPVRHDAPARELRGHAGGVWCCAVLGAMVVSGSTDRTLRVWDAASGECLLTLVGHTSTVRCVCLNGSIIASGSRDSTVRIWSVYTGENIFLLRGHADAVRCLEMAGDVVVSGSYDFHLRVWSLRSGECLHTLVGHDERIYSLQFDGRLIVSGSLDLSMKVWDVESGLCLRTLRGHQSLTGLMLLKGNLLVSANADSTLRVWDVDTGQCVHQLQGHNNAVTNVYFNGKFVISSSDDGTVKLWDLQTGQFVRDLLNLNASILPGDPEWRVVWRVQCTDTQLFCAVGRRELAADTTKIIVFDFLAD